MNLRLATLNAVSLYLLHNGSTLNHCRNLSCVTAVCKHFVSYQGYPNYRWYLIWYAKGWTTLLLFKLCLNWWKFSLCWQGKGKDKLYSSTGHEGPERECRYSSTHSLTSALDEGGWSMPRPGRFTPRKKPGTLCRRVWVDPRTGLDGCGKSLPHRDSIPGPSSP
jgi:hypothetical protein